MKGKNKEQMEIKVWQIVLLVVALAAAAESSSELYDEASSGLNHYYTSHEYSVNSNVGDIIGEENEMIMDSETNRRTLAERKKFIGYGALRKNAVPCGRRGNSYYNCQDRERANPYRRGCAYITRCARR